MLLVVFWKLGWPTKVSPLACLERQRNRGNNAESNRGREKKPLIYSECCRDNYKLNNLGHHDLLTHILIRTMIRFVLLFNGELQYSLDFIGRFDRFFSCRGLNVTYSTSFPQASNSNMHVPLEIKYPTLLPSPQYLLSQSNLQQHLVLVDYVITGNFHQNLHLTTEDDPDGDINMDRIEEEEEDSGQLHLLLPFRHPCSVNYHLIVVITFIIDIIYLVIGVDEQSESSLMNPLMVLKLYK